MGCELPAILLSKSEQDEAERIVAKVWISEAGRAL